MTNLKVKKYRHVIKAAKASETHEDLPQLISALMKFLALYPNETITIVPIGVDDFNGKKRKR